MGVSQWWLYDLVVIAIGVLCIWNGASGGARRALGGFIVSAASLIAALLLSVPVSEALYAGFFQDTCQGIVEEKLDDADLAGNMRAALEGQGIYLPYENDELADMIEDFSRNDAAIEQAAGMIGLDADALESELGKALQSAAVEHGDMLPEWAVDAVKDSDSDNTLETIADTTASLLRNDNSEAAAGIEETYVKPVILPFLRMLSFVVISFLLSMLLRMFTAAIPGGDYGALGSVIGGTIGAVKACIYICLVVLLVQCIISMDDGSYPFFSMETVDKTMIFGKLYNIFADIL